MTVPHHRVCPLTGKKTTVIFSVASLLLALGTVAGCSKSPAELQKKYQTNGLHYLSEGKYSEAVIEFQNLLKINPRSVEGHYELGEAYKKKGWITDSLIQFRDAVQLSPTYLPPHIELARYGINSAQWPSVKPEIDTILKLAPQDPHGWAFKGQRDLALGEPDKAREALTKALSVKPDFVRAIVAMGDLDLLEKHPDQAKAQYQKALDLSQNNSRAWIGLGKVAAAGGHQNEELIDFRKAVSVDPKNIRSSIVLANELAREGHLKQAISQLEILSKGHTDLRIPLKIAEYDTLLGKNTEAVDLLRPYAQQKLPIIELYFVMAKAYEQMGNKEEATANVDKLMELKFDNPPIAVSAAKIRLTEGDPQGAMKILSTLGNQGADIPNYWLVKGASELSLGKTRTALSDLEQGTQQFPSFSPLPITLADGYIIAKKPQKALAILNDLLSRNPDNTPALVRKAGILARTQGPASAIAFLKRKVAQFPKDRNLEVSYLQALSGNKETDSAIREARSYLEKNPSDPVVTLLLADLHLQKGQTDDAKRELKTLIAANPKNLGALNTLATIDLGQKHFPEAESLYRQAIALSPDNAGLYTSLGETLSAEQQKEAANTAFQKALSLNPNQPLALLELSRSEVTSGETPRAVVHLTPLLKMNLPAPQAAEVQWLWGVVSMQEGDYSRAQTALEKSVTLAPDNATYHQSLGDLWTAFQNWKKAYAELSKAYSLDTADTLVKIKRDWIALNLGQGKPDKNRIQQVIDEAAAYSKNHPDNPTAAMIEARGDLMTGKSDDALKVFDRILAKNPANTDAILGKAGLLLSRKQTKDARALVGQLLTDHPNNIQGNLLLAEMDAKDSQFQDEASRLEIVYQHYPKWTAPAVELGRVDTILGRYSQARSILSPIVARHPDLAQATINLARDEMGLSHYRRAIDTLSPLTKTEKKPLGIYLLMSDAAISLGDRNEAIGYLKQALHVEPHNLIALNNLAFLLSANKNELPQAITYARSALAVSRQPFIEDTLGYLYYLSGRYHKAQEYLEAAKKAGFKNPEFQYHLGLNEWKLGQTKKAGNDLKEALVSGSLSADEKETAHKALDQMTAG